MIPITPIGIETFSIFRLSSVIQPSNTRPIGSLSPAISSKATAIASILSSLRRSLSLSAEVRLLVSASLMSLEFSSIISIVLALSARAISFKIAFFSALES